MVGNKFSNTSVESIGSLLNNNIEFRVPKFQRNYSWERDDVLHLWRDLMTTFMAVKDKPKRVKAEQYLLGSIVLVPDDENDALSIIDGQQRLATLTLLFCVARDIMAEYGKNGESEKKVDPTIKSMTETKHIGKQQGWKLVLNDTDEKTFREIQACEHGDFPTQKERFKKSKPSTDSAKRLSDNYKFLHERIIEALVNGFSDDVQEHDDAELKEEDLQRLCIENMPKLVSFINCIVEYNFVVKIEVPDDDTAYQVFQTLNDRGERLTESNLIKTDVLRKASADQNKQVELNQRWNEIFDKKIGRDQSDNDFILESLRSRDPDSKASIRNLYRIIQKKIGDGPGECESYVEHLEEDVEFVSQLNNPETYNDPNTLIEIEAVHALGAKLFRTPIIAAHRRWGFDANYKTVVVALVKFFFKFRVVRREHPGEVERLMLKWTKMIKKGSQPEQILDSMREHDDHAHFIREFDKFAKKPSPKVAKYILQQINIHMKSQYDDVKPISDLTLEHILPQKYQGWNKDKFFEGYDSQEDIADFVNRLGNLTLLIGSINTKLKNMEFYEKKNRTDKKGNPIGYISSKLDINIETVRNKNEWTAKVIREREELFIGYAREIWRL